MEAIEVDSEEVISILTFDAKNNEVHGPDALATGSSLLVVLEILTTFQATESDMRAKDFYIHNWVICFHPSAALECHYFAQQKPYYVEKAERLLLAKCHLLSAVYMKRSLNSPVAQIQTSTHRLLPLWGVAQQAEWVGHAVVHMARLNPIVLNVDEHCNCLLLVVSF